MCVCLMGRWAQCLYRGVRELYFSVLEVYDMIISICRRESWLLLTTDSLGFGSCLMYGL